MNLMQSAVIVAPAKVVPSVASLIQTFYRMVSGLDFDAYGPRFGDLIKTLLGHGILASINHELDPELAEGQAERRDRFYGQLARGGVFAHPRHHGFLCARHTQAELDRVLEVCREAARRL